MEGTEEIKYYSWKPIQGKGRKQSFDILDQYIIGYNIQRLSKFYFLILLSISFIIANWIIA